MSPCTADYVCLNTEHPSPPDRVLPEAAWQNTMRSDRFVDVVTGAAGFLDTRVGALWNTQALFVQFEIVESLIETRCTQRDALVFAEKPVELMIDGGDCYYELAINALGTIYEVFFIWKDAFRQSGRFDRPEFDVLKRNALTFCGDSDRNPETFWRGTHPRGCRWVFLDWDLPGLCVNVSIDESMNYPTHADVGWRTDLVIPWAGMQWLAGGRSLPPTDGDEWRIYIRLQSDACCRRKGCSPSADLGATASWCARRASAGAVLTDYVLETSGSVRREVMCRVPIKAVGVRPSDQGGRMAQCAKEE